MKKLLDRKVDSSKIDIKTINNLKIINMSEQTEKKITHILKRNGELDAYNIEKIFQAIWKAVQEVGGTDEREARRVAEDVEKMMNSKFHYRSFPAVEEVQDMVEKALIEAGHAKTAKAFIIYRERRNQLRRKISEIPSHVKELVKESKKYFRNPLAEFVYYRTYAKWIFEENRRETWIETVNRYVDFMKENLGDKLSLEEYSEVRDYILNQQAMPSMRLVQFAGQAARKTNVCAYNCSYVAPESPRDIAEIIYILMCGTGVGFSIESQNVQKFPQIKYQTGEKIKIHKIDDSKEGWADAFILGMETWMNGQDIDFDYTGLRPAGARLKTMGGKSSGPDPLRQLMAFTKERVFRKQGRRLSNIDVHDIICKVGECVVAGGVRRSALISLSDLDDDKMRDAKKGQFYHLDPQRSLANNSAVYNQKPSNEEFMDEWIALMKSGSGERGIFNRGSLKSTLPARRIDKLDDGEIPQWGTNPCGEIILKSKQFCNLSEVVAREDDTEESLLDKVRIATILGTYQSNLTNFPYLSETWKSNCQKERLLGVSITGQWDCKVVRNAEILKKLKNEAIKVNKEYSKKLGIPESTCITCVKPSGTVSQVVDCSSGMHPRHSAYYLRRVRIASTDSLFKMLKDQGVVYYPEVGQNYENATTYVLEFPMKSPEGAIFKDDIGSLDQLKHWKLVKENYTEHNPSVTISIGAGEWIDVAHWVYKNWDIVGGLSFLPRFDHVYALAPYEAIDKATYEEKLSKMKDIDFSRIMAYEKQDETDVKKELACVGGSCDLI
jgi:ribonucleoside-triphosphate reductase (thioredoxin)